MKTLQQTAAAERRARFLSQPGARAARNDRIRLRRKSEAEAERQAGAVPLNGRQRGMASRLVPQGVVSEGLLLQQYRFGPALPPVMPRWMAAPIWPASSCRFPRQGDHQARARAGAPDVDLYCCKPSLPGKSYCAEHGPICLVPWQGDTPSRPR